LSYRPVEGTVILAHDMQRWPSLAALLSSRTRMDRRYRIWFASWCATNAANDLEPVCVYVATGHPHDEW